MYAVNKSTGRLELPESTIDHLKNASTVQYVQGGKVTTGGTYIARESVGRPLRKGCGQSRGLRDKLVAYDTVVVQ